MSNPWCVAVPIVRRYSPNREESVNEFEPAKIGWNVESTILSPGCEEHRATFQPIKDGCGEIAVGFQINAGQVKDAHVVIPAAVYAGNRFRAKTFPYPCIIDDPADFRADLPNTISNVSRLPRIQLLAGDASVPAIGIGDFDKGRAVWIFSDAMTSQGYLMLEVLETDNLSASILAGGVRTPMRYHGCGFDWLPSDDQGWRPTLGEELTVRIRTLVFPATSPPDLFAALFDHRHDLWMPGGRHELPWSAAFAIQEAKYNRENWDPERRYYAVGDRKTRYAHWQIGWVGGGISSHALLVSGAPATQSKALDTLDWMADRGQSPSGFFWSVGIEDEMFSDMVDMDWGHDWHLIRRSGDALYFFCKQVFLAKRITTVKKSWLGSIRTCADAFVRLWLREGQFGQFVSQETGEIRVGRTASGAIAPAGLALASRLLSEPKYLEVAKESALYYVREFLEAGYTSGGPGEASQCPDSESAFGLLESLVTLFEETRDAAWLGHATRAAHLCASWVMPYDFPFPMGSSFGKLDMRTTGTVWANSQNKHSAPGICTLSGVSLFKLFRATGDARFLHLVSHISHAISQYLSREDRPVFSQPPGWMCERVNTSDWEHPQNPVGEGFAASCWCEVSSMLSYAELPGVYVQPDTGLAVALDHVDIQLDMLPETIIVTVRNPTNFAAKVKVLSELSSQTTQILGQDFAASLPVIDVRPHGATEVRFDRKLGCMIT